MINGIQEIKGKYNTIEMVDPEYCYFIAEYPDGSSIKGKNLIDTGWAELPEGFSKLKYHLSNNLIIDIPKFDFYLHLVEVSQALYTDDRVYHSINIKGRTDNTIVNYRIELKQHNNSDKKIGDISITFEDNTMNSPHWKQSC